MKEYELTVDVVIALPDNTDAEAFQDALLSAVIQIVEAAGGRMGGSFNLQEWTGDEEE